MPTYLNHYGCTTCGHRWSVPDCDSTHNDKCPECNCEMEVCDFEYQQEHTDIEIAVNYVRKSYAHGTLKRSPIPEPEKFMGDNPADVIGKMMISLMQTDVYDHPIKLSLVINTP